MPALLALETTLAIPTPSVLSCIIGGSPLIERDDTDVYEEASCLANELMQNAEGLMNPNGFSSTFREQIVEVVNVLPPDLIPVFPDLRSAGAFAISWPRATQSSVRCYFRSWLQQVGSWPFRFVSACHGNACFKDRR